jgi:hypothetical protein
VTESKRSGDVDGVGDDGTESDEEYAPTPFDNPFFLPVLLIGFSIWFIYDGWFNPDMEWIKFNRIGAATCSLLGIWFTVKAIRERRAASRPNGPG